MKSEEFEKLMKIQEESNNILEHQNELLTEMVKQGRRHCEFFNNICQALILIVQNSVPEDGEQTVFEILEDIHSELESINTSSDL